LWAGLDLVDPARTLDLVRRCQHHGVLVGSMLHDAKTIRFAPPLVIDEDDMRRGVEIVATAAAEVLA
jgi:4-aminobutyrate aminotransferase-like enzyme